MAANKVYCIGRNPCGELAFDHNKKIHKLTKLTNKSVHKAFPYDSYIIFSDNDHKQIWGSGDNQFGQIGIGYQGDDDPSNVYPYHPITYFEKNEITISKICKNVRGWCTFFISDTGKLYVCGRRYIHNVKAIHEYEPKLVEELENVIDAQSSKRYSIAICQYVNEKQLLIISYWCRLYKINNDIMELLIAYSKSNRIYSTTNKPGSGHPEYSEFTDTWKEIEFFKTENINIIKIALGDETTFFLDDTGTVWGCCHDPLFLGNGKTYGIFSAHKHTVYIPIKITFFIENGIIIKDIQCGYVYTLALDTNGKVYSWGVNNYGQCGFDGDDDRFIYKPKRIGFFDNYFVDKIKCGWNHSYVGTRDGRHYLFGDNQDFACLGFGGDRYGISPHCVNEIVKAECKTSNIVDVILGRYNTIIIVASNLEL